MYDITLPTTVTVIPEGDNGNPENIYVTGLNPDDWLLASAPSVDGAIIYLHHAAGLDTSGIAINWGGFPLTYGPSKAYIQVTLNQQNGFPTQLYFRAYDGTGANVTIPTPSTWPANNVLLDVSSLDLATLYFQVYTFTSLGGTWTPPITTTISNPVLLTVAAGSLVAIGHGVNCNVYYGF
jgi:hypothetical protein